MGDTSLGRAREVLRIFSGMRSADFFRKFFVEFFRRFLRRNFERGNLLCRMPVQADRSRPSAAIRLRYSMTSSAVASSEGGTVSPRVFTVLRLMQWAGPIGEK